MASSKYVDSGKVVCVKHNAHDGFLASSILDNHLRCWGPDSGRWGRFMKAVKLFSDPTKTKIYKRLAL